ncbi:MAG: RNA polymerase sigma factor [Clostridia bacterium]|nr:RNA polymerase sigma factor [Clostridia bacterium]
MTKEEFERRLIDMQDTMYRVASTILNRSCDREDAIQECVYRALRKRASLKSDDAMRGWVIRILINECYAILRRAKRECLSDELPEAQPRPDPGANEDVFRALFSLGRDLRLPLVLHYVEGYSVEEIARVLRVPAGTVKSRMNRARKKLKLELEEEANG